MKKLISFLPIKSHTINILWFLKRQFNENFSVFFVICSVFFVFDVQGQVCTPPAKPTGLMATAVSSSQINLSWNAVSGAIGYDLSYCNGTYIGFVSGTSYSHTGRAASTNYSYKVQAQKSATCVSGFTNCASATTPAACIAPAKPTGLTATAVSSSQINLSWNAVSGVIGYDLSYCDGTYIGFVSGTSYSHTGRAASTNYSYKVQAQKSATCVSGFTTCASATTPSSCTPPAKPTGLSATAASSSQINLSWNSVSGAVGYDISYCDGTYITYTTSTSYQHTGRAENTNYSYNVQAQKSATCVSGFTTCASATTSSSCTPPAKPIGLTATAVSSSQIDLSWNAVSGAIGYDVSYCDGTYIGYVTGTSYSHTGRVENTNYSYNVQAQKNATCVSGFTTCASATTPSIGCTPPAKPTGLTATAVSSSQINLSWNAVSGAIGYDVSYCDGTYIGYTTNTTYPSTGRMENTTYSYIVQAQKNATCVSGFTSCASATTMSSCTPPAKPTGLTATAVSTSQINLSWNAVSGAIGYDVSYCDGTYIGYVTGTSYSHTGRVENTNYSYNIQAQKSATCVSGFTTCASATTPSIGCTPPAKPTGLSATAVSTSQINLSWNAVSGAIGYDVSYCDGKYIGYVTGTSYSHTGRVENTNYSYKVQAQKSSTCVSGFTTCASATTRAASSISQIQWSGFTWNVSNRTGNPGSNNWSSNSSNVWVDNEGNLHLKTTKVGDKWYCAEISSVESFGYGEYTFQTSSRIDQLEKNMVFGLFTYKGNGEAVTPQENEIDIEFSRWNNEINPNSQYGFQYREAYTNSNLISPYSFETKLNGSNSTHKFIWTKGNIFFQSYHGNSADLPSDDYLIFPSKTFSDTRIPAESGEKVVLNLYLFQGNALPYQQETEVIIKSFKFKPIDPKITLTYPIGGEKWEIGEKKLIQWKSTYLTGRVNIEINGDYPNRGWDPLAMNVVDNGSYLYTVNGTEGSTKRIRISSVNNSNIKAESGNLTFTKPIEFIILTSPKGGEQWPIGTIQTIKWETNSLFQNVNIDVNGNYPNGQWETIKRDISNDQVYFYTVNGTEGTSKRIRVSLTNKQAVKGESNNFSFTKPEATITVSSPNGGEEWEIGTQRTITWESTNLIGNVTIEVNGNFPDGQWEKIQENIPNNHTYTFKVEGTPGKQKRIRVKSASIPTINGISDANFAYITKSVNESNSIIDVLVEYANNLEDPDAIENSNLYKLYYDDKDPKKIFGYISASLPLIKALGVKMFIDLDDYYSAKRSFTHPGQIGITAEGKDEQWVTIWVNAEVAAEVSLGLPFGIGITPPTSFDKDMPDPKMSFSFSAFKTTLPFFQLTGLEANMDGTKWSSTEKLKEIPKVGATLAEIGFNLHRFEIEKGTLDKIINSVFIKFVDKNGKLDVLNFVNAVNELASTFFSIDEKGKKIIMNPSLSGKFRPYSSTDNNQTGVDGAINFLYGGIDSNLDGRKDNCFPVIPKTFLRLPLNANQTDLTFQNTGKEKADFFIKVTNWPKGWIVKSTDDRWIDENNIIDKIYDASDVPRSEYNTFFTTYWTIGCLYGADDEADITFELFHRENSISNQLLDTKKIKVKKQKEAGNHTPVLVPIFPNSNISLGRDDELTISWTDVDIDDNASIALAIDPDVFINDPSTLGADLNPTPWEGLDNHTWIADNIKENDNGSDGSFTFKTHGYAAGDYSLWAVIYDGKNEPLYVKFDGILSITLKFDDLIPYSLINSIKDKWINSNPELDIDSYDNVNLNTTSYQVLSASNIKSARILENNALKLDALEENWNPLTSNGSTILGESVNNLEDSLTRNWKIRNSDWDNIIANNQDLEKHYVVLKITDDAGNTYITPDINSAFELKIDIHNPNVNIINPTEVQNLLSNTVDVNWIANDLYDGIQLSGIDKIFISLDQAIDLIQLESNITNYTFKNLNNGVHTFYVQAKDAAGNFSELKHVNFSINSAIQLPEIITSNVSSISSTSAFCGGIITDSRGVEIIEKGLCWSTSINPTISLLTKTNEGTGSGMFVSSMNGLEAEKTYFVRAYATNCAGTAYGQEFIFTTPKEITSIELNGNFLKMFPNPNNGEFTIQLDTKVGESIIIEVYNQFGQRVFWKQEISSASNYLKVINLGEVSSGIYFVRAKTKSNIQSAKIILID